MVCWDHANQEKAFKKSLSLVAKALKIERGNIVMSAMTHGQNMETLSGMTDSLSNQEKSKKPKFSRHETLEHLCYLNSERTKLLMESLASGQTENIKNSENSQEEKQKFFLLVNAKVNDKLYVEKEVDEEDLSFAMRYFKSD